MTRTQRVELLALLNKVEWLISTGKFLDVCLALDEVRALIAEWEDAK